jgi:putative ABC transport system permease protein
MIRLENVSKYYYSVNMATQALRKINLEFQIGEFVTITGESGSGKSTLLNIISGLDTYDEGELYINSDETSIYDDSDWEEYRKNKMGFVFQSYNLIDHYSALYNVESSLIIQGYSNKEAKKTAKRLLKRVGLGDKMNQKAENLSSGQKQRLSIARALAKNTDIIVADEPTGNLDSETGRQIMELFAELSKDRLIIVVTHNYEEAAPFVTRKIRLHEGEVVSDEPVKEGYAVSREDSVNKEVPVSSKDSVNKEVPVSSKDSVNKEVPVSSEDFKKVEQEICNPAPTDHDQQRTESNRKIALNFAWMNISTQPKRALFFLVFLLITAAVSYIFLGEIYSNWDDTNTKKYDNSAFLNGDNTRIVVKRVDSGDITVEDMDTFRGINYVSMADQYGFSSDINYYITKGSDYDLTYVASDNQEEAKQSVEFLDETHFMKSSTCIKEADLSAGVLPTERNEIVLYSDNKEDLGKEQPCYFTSLNMWGYKQYYTTTVKVVGLLKQISDQVYFSGELCNMLSVSLYGDHYMLKLNWDLFEGRYKDEVTFIPVIGEGIEYIEGSPQLKASRQLILSKGSAQSTGGELDYFIGGEEGDSLPDVIMNASLLDYNELSTKFVEMNEEQFYELFPWKSRQASLYIKDYIDTDYVLKHLKDMGYIAISSYRISSIKYDDALVAMRLTIILKALLVLLITGILEIVIIRSIFQIKKKNYMVLKSMGMNPKTITLMNYFEMLLYTGISVILVPLAAGILSLFGFVYLKNMVKYYNIFTFTFYAVMNLLIITVVVWSFGRYMKRKQKWS